MHILINNFRNFLWYTHLTHRKGVKSDLGAFCKLERWQKIDDFEPICRGKHRFAMLAGHVDEAFLIGRQGNGDWKWAGRAIFCARSRVL